MKTTLFLFLSCIGLIIFSTGSLAQDNRDKASLTVYKSPTCGCCAKWVDHLQANNFIVQTQDRQDMASIKQQAGIQPQYQSCHTGLSAQGYVFEGHVPARYIDAFLADVPEGAIGLSVPAMPIGSPGMEMGVRFQAYKVMLLMKDGSSKVFASVNSPADQ